MSDDLTPACMKRIAGAIQDARGLAVLNIVVIVMDGEVRLWRVDPTQYEPHNANRVDAREELFKALSQTWGGEAL